MKKSRIFATVIYFIFTFGIGVLFAVTLPGYFATFTVPAEVIAEALAGKDFLTGIVLTEPVGFYREPVLEAQFGGGGVVLYETVAEVYDRNAAKEDAEPSGGLTHGMLYKAYTGYVYGVSGSYDVFSEGPNGTSLRVTDSNGTEKKLPLLDYDANGDGTNDGISTFTQNGFIILEIRESDVSSVMRLGFTDKTGATVFTAETARTLDFTGTFFDRFGDIGGYNELVAAGSREGVSAEESAAYAKERNDYVEAVIRSLEEDPVCAVTSRSEEYKAASALVNKRANGKAIPFVIVYFIAIYIIADFLLGTHYIIKFFRWFLFKVCKIPHKEKKAPAKEEVFGHDYYCTVTLRLDLSEAPDFNGSAEIKYTNGGEEFVFSLLKEEGYTATQRLKAGVYVNPFIDIDRTYAPVDLPDNLEVEGYQMEKTVKIVRREV